MLNPRRVVQGVVNYTREMSERARYFAVDHTKDNLYLDPRTVDIEDARGASDPPRLDREGFVLVPHTTGVQNFRDPEEVATTNAPEVEQLLRRLTGADAVVCKPPGVLRWSEASPDSGTLVNSVPARFIHIDINDPTALAFAEQAKPREMGPMRRYAHYNVWRALSPPPQDVPLTLCDARTLAPQDLMVADAVFDAPNSPQWSFEGLVVHHSPRHRWVYFSDMTADEVIVFKTNDSDPAQPHHVPHSAFDDPTCPKGVIPRASIEMRAIAFWMS